MKCHALPLMAPALALTAALGAAAPAHAYLSETFRDWTATCNNGLTCEMQSSLPDGAPIYSITFERIGAANAPVAIMLDPRSEVDAAAGSVVLSIADAASVTLDLTEAERLYDGSRLRFADPAGVRSLVEAMKAGKTLDLVLDFGNGETSHSISLSGVTASLLFIDEVQGRVDRTDALQAVGKLPAKDPDVRPVTSLDAFSESVRADFAEPSICGGLDLTRFAELDGFLIDRGDEGILAVLPCGIGGAYNQPYTLYGGAEPDELRPIGFPMIDTDGPVSTPTTYNIAYDAREDRLTSFARGRGLGDCGSYFVWSIAGRGSWITPALVEQREKGDCDGDYAGGPEKWPLSWPR